MSDTPTIHTVGHSNLTLRGLLDLLGSHGIRCVVDVRSWPSSRRYPWFGKDGLEESLREAGIDYAWEKALGGKRRPVPEDGIHDALEAPMLRAYVRHLHSTEAREAIGRLLALARSRPTTVMCAERDPARCHRSLLADRLVTLHGARVVHVIDGRTTRPHALHPDLSVEDERLVYRAAQQTLL